jgi:hypothetical protein
MHIRVHLQLAEALGDVNRWFCSEFYNRAISDPHILLEYFIRNGGAANFAHRFRQAFSDLNRYYCSEYYGRHISDPVVIWNYYMEYRGGKEFAQARDQETVT